MKKIIKQWIQQQIPAFRNVDENETIHFQMCDVKENIINYLIHQDETLCQVKLISGQLVSMYIQRNEVVIEIAR